MEGTGEGGGGGGGRWVLGDTRLVGGGGDVNDECLGGGWVEGTAGECEGGGGGCDLVEGEDLEVGGGGDLRNGRGEVAFLGDGGLFTGGDLLIGGGTCAAEPPHFNLLQSTGVAAGDEHSLTDL